MTSNPRVDHSYRRWRGLQSDLERYYEDCMSGSAGGFRGGRKKGYCSGVAWKRARVAGRYKDYPAFRRPVQHAAEVAAEVTANPNPSLAIGIGIAAAIVVVGAFFIPKANG